MPSQENKESDKNLTKRKIIGGILFASFLVFVASSFNELPSNKEKSSQTAVNKQEVKIASPAEISPTYAKPIIKLDPNSLAVTATSTIETNETRCDLIECNAGTKVISYATKSEPFYACPTNELATYANYVMGIASFVVQITGQLPNISPVTGEPEQEGESKFLMDKLRSEAGVSTFDEAIMHCQSGKNKMRLMVMNNPKEGFQMWVGNEKTKTSFWMPKSHLNIIK